MQESKNIFWIIAVTDRAINFLLYSFQKILFLIEIEKIIFQARAFNFEIQFRYHLSMLWEIIEELCSPIDAITRRKKETRGRLKYIYIYCIFESPWRIPVESTRGRDPRREIESGVRVQRRGVLEKFRGSWKGKWNARIRGMPTVRLAISLPRPISSHYPAVSQPYNT